MLLSLINAADPMGTSGGGGAIPSVGWQGFLDYPGMVQELSALVLATLLALVIAYHPTTARTVDTIEEAELPKVYIMYALVGAVVGVIVLQFGTVVGFVVFGLGGLMRFRTETGSTRDTGRLIIVTLVGLISGLNVPHFAVIATAFAWLIILIFDANPVYRLDVTQIPKDRVNEAFDAYRRELVNSGCSMVSSTRGFGKGKLQYVFRAPRKFSLDSFYEASSVHIPPELTGEMEWKVQ